jgi:hypothetical protein
VVEPRDRGRQGLPFRRRTFRLGATRLELVEELQHPRPTLDRVVELEVELGDPLQAEALAQLVANERHCPPERLQGGLPIARLTDDADGHAGMTEIGRRLDAGDRGEPDPGIVEVAGQDRRHLLPEKLVDPRGSLRHRAASARRRSISLRRRPSIASAS